MLLLFWNLLDESSLDHFLFSGLNGLTPGVCFFFFFTLSSLGTWQLGGCFEALCLEATTRFGLMEEVRGV